MKKLKILIVSFCIIIYFVYSTGLDVEFIENLDIPSGVGIDIKKTNDNDVIYKVPTSIYIFEPNGPGDSRVVDGGSSTIGETREERNRHEDKNLMFGLQRVYVMSERYARFGIKNILDILFKTPTANDMGYMVVCKGDPSDILKYKMTGYKSSSDFIDGLIKNAKSHDFLGGEDYKLIDVCIESVAEGRSIVLPYIEMDEMVPAITGMAIFKKNKMVNLLNMYQSKFMNLLRGDNSNGILVIRKDPIHYVTFDAKSRRKVKCHKENGKYFFDIYLNLTGDVIENEIYNNMIGDEAIQEKFQRNLEKETENNCYKFLDEMQNRYKMDLLNLGRNAVAKYGRKTGTDWDQAVSTATINVHVNIKISTLGRGDL